MSDYRREIFPIFLGNAGCAQRCIFCNQGASSVGHDLSLEAMRGYLDNCLPARGHGEIAFYGGSFTLLSQSRQRQMLELGSAMIRDGRVRGVRISTRPDAISEETVDVLKGYGVTTVELGCQSFSEPVLRASGRTYPAGCVDEAVRLLKGAGVDIGLQLMPGLPGADDEEAFSSLDAAIDLKPAFLRIYPTVVLRGTRLESEYAAGNYRPWSLARTIRVGARLLRRAHEAATPVIRFGLQTSAELAESVVAGPCHPALGQLVRGRIWYEAIAGELTRDEVVMVHRSDLSDAHGYKRRNVRHLNRLYGLQISVDERVPRGYYGRGDRLHKVPGIRSEGAKEHV